MTGIITNQSVVNGVAAWYVRNQYDGFLYTVLDPDGLFRMGDTIEITGRKDGE